MDLIVPNLSSTTPGQAGMKIKGRWLLPNCVERDRVLLALIL